jgi:hypothetical protein
MKEYDRVVDYFKKKQKNYHHTEKGMLELERFEELLDDFEQATIDRIILSTY